MYSTGSSTQYEGVTDKSNVTGSGSRVMVPEDHSRYWSIDSFCCKISRNVYQDVLFDCGRPSTFDVLISEKLLLFRNLNVTFSP